MNIVDFNEEKEVVLNLQDKNNLKQLCNKVSTGQKCTKSTWIVDSGMSCHMTNNGENMIDAKRINECIGIGNIGKK